MLTLNDINTIEGDYEDQTDEEYYFSLQRAINSGMAWKMQGSMGRAMMDAISSGRCMLGRDQASDYWGNTLPSRDEIKQGTKGSYQFVVKQNGIEYADMMLEA